MIVFECNTCVSAMVRSASFFLCFVTVLCLWELRRATGFSPSQLWTNWTVSTREVRQKLFHSVGSVSHYSSVYSDFLLNKNKLVKHTATESRGISVCCLRFLSCDQVHVGHTVTQMDCSTISTDRTIKILKKEENVLGKV